MPETFSKKFALDRRREEGVVLPSASLGVSVDGTAISGHDGWDVEELFRLIWEISGTACSGRMADSSGVTRGGEFAPRTTFKVELMSYREGRECVSCAAASIEALDGSKRWASGNKMEFLLGKPWKLWFLMGWGLKIGELSISVVNLCRFNSIYSFRSIYATV